MRTELDIVAEKAYAREEGFEEGREEEREKSHQKLVAVGMSLIKEKGMSIDEVCHFTGLSPEDFQQERLDKQLDYVFAMLSEQDKLEIREAYYADGFEEGEVKGKVEGLEKAKAAVALLKQGCTVSEICEKTGLSPKDVLALQ